MKNRNILVTLECFVKKANKMKEFALEESL